MNCFHVKYKNLNLRLNLDSVGLYLISISIRFLHCTLVYVIVVCEKLYLYNGNRKYYEFIVLWA